MNEELLSEALGYLGGETEVPVITYQDDLIRRLVVELRAGADDRFLDRLADEMAKAVENPGVASASTGYPLPDYSQSGEQAAILKVAGELPVGRFLDIGAGDGRTFSNTRALALLGWGGVCVEPAAWAFERLVRLYGGDGSIACVSACVTGKSEGLQTFLYTRDDHLSTTVPAEAAKWPRVPFQRVFAAALTLDELLSELGADISVVSIDAEGRTLELLEAYQRHHLWDNVRCLCFEVVHASERRFIRGDGWLEVASTPNNVVLAR